MTGRYKILNLATHDFGGAGIASVIVNGHLRDLGHESVLMVREKRGTSPHTVHYDCGGHFFIAKHRRREQERKEIAREESTKAHYGYTGRMYYDFDERKASARKILSQAGFRPDLILLHWVAGFITPDVINDLKRLTGAKIAWLMMDNAPITGGCHYPGKCTRYRTDCRNCPLFNNPEWTRSAQRLSEKLALLPPDLELWGTATDIERVAQSAIGRDLPRQTMLFPIDESLISNAERSVLRQELKLPRNRIIIMAGCSDISDERKGGDLLLCSLLLLRERRPDLSDRTTLLLVGNNSPAPFHHIGCDILYPGRLSMSDLMKCYAAADIYISPSTEDSGPLMVNQAIASGTPVLAFDIGVARELVADGKSGALAVNEDLEGLYGSLVRLLEKCADPAQAEAMRDACRRIYSDTARRQSMSVCVEAIMSR